jgi:hypothetical protein
MNNIEQINFHDAYILELQVCTITDHFEVIKILLESKEFIKDYGTNKISLVFRECFKAELKLQMWIKGKDSIRELRIIDEKESNDLNNIAEMKRKGFVKDSDNFKYCEITLNTSDGKIHIIAKEVSIKIPG